MFKKILVAADDFFYKGIMRNLLKLSKLGYGFVVSGAESGVNYEHVYDDVAKGQFIVGRFVDRALLNLPAVRATLARKDEIKNVLWNEIQNNKVNGKKTIVLDVASGGARYLRELREEHNEGLVESLCVDRDANCTSLGSRLAEKEGVANLRFFTADVFKMERLKIFAARRQQQVNVIIASGIFIYFKDEIVEKMLEEMYRVLPVGGLIVFTSYKKLNTRKLMRKAMVTSTGDQWTLYYRKTEYWRTVLKRIGYSDVFISRDKWLMNNVCHARK